MGGNKRRSFDKLEASVCRICYEIYGHSFVNVGGLTSWKCKYEYNSHEMYF